MIRKATIAMLIGVGYFWIGATAKFEDTETGEVYQWHKPRFQVRWTRTTLIPAKKNIPLSP